MSPPYYSAEDVVLHLGDSLEVLPTLPDASVDAIVTDPPYEIAFMNREWDASGIAYNTELWRQCWRVLKPGGHLLAFGATRTYHRMAVAIEDAGFEIRDSLHWIYGSGFPKGQDIPRSIDRRRDDRSDVLRVTAWLAGAVKDAGWTTRRMNELFGFDSMAGHWVTQGVAATVPTPEQWQKLREAVGFDDTEILPLVEELHGRRGMLGEALSRREVVGTKNAGLHQGTGDSVMLKGIASPAAGRTIAVTAPASDAARQWQGWNTALKPAHEPIVLARKSTGFNTTVANVLEHGTGALNIDGCRTDTVSAGPGTTPASSVAGRRGSMAGPLDRVAYDGSTGRWPTNVLLGHGPDCIDDGECQPGCPVTEMDQQSGTTGSNARANKGERHGTLYNKPSGASGPRGHEDFGGASRFFPVFRYEAKAPASERPRLADGTAHTTVKPLALMQWLVRLVTPPGGLVLDPFAGSGTTLAAALREGMRAVGVEQHEPYAQLCVQRLSEPYTQALFA